MEIQGKLVRDHPESPVLASDLGGTLNNLATIQIRENRLEAARLGLQEAVHWQRTALSSNPTNPTYRKFLVNHLGHLITVARAMDDAQGLAEAERELAAFLESDPALVALDARLSAIIRGEQPPTDNRDRLQLAQRACNNSIHAAAAKLWAEAID